MGARHAPIGLRAWDPKLVEQPEVCGAEIDLMCVRHAFTAPVWQEPYKVLCPCQGQCMLPGTHPLVEQPGTRGGGRQHSDEFYLGARRYRSLCCCWGCAMGCCTGRLQLGTHANHLGLADTNGRRASLLCTCMPQGSFPMHVAGSASNRMLLENVVESPSLQPDAENGQELEVHH